MFCSDCHGTFTLYPEASLNIDLIIEALKDGLWHTLNEISAYSGLKRITFIKLIDLLDFLEDYSFIESQETFKDGLPIKQFRLALPVQDFYKKISQIE